MYEWKLGRLRLVRPLHPGDQWCLRTRRWLYVAPTPRALAGAVAYRLRIPVKRRPGPGLPGPVLLDYRHGRWSAQVGGLREYGDTAERAVANLEHLVELANG